MIPSNSTFADLPDNAVGVLGLGEKSCNPTCIDPIYNSIRDSITWATDVFSICFGQKEGVLSFGIVDRKFQVFLSFWNEAQNGSLFYTTQIPNELGYTYDVVDLRTNNQSFVSKSDVILAIDDDAQKVSALLTTTESRILLPPEIYDKWVAFMKDHFSHLPGTLRRYPFPCRRAERNGFPRHGRQRYFRVSDLRHSVLRSAAPPVPAPVFRAPEDGGGGVGVGNPQRQGGERMMHC